MFAQFKKYLNTDRTPTLEEGNQLLKQGKFAEAIDCYHQIIEQNPNSAEAYQKLAETLKAQGSLEKATLYYRQAIGLNAAKSEAKKNLIQGNSLLKTSNQPATLPKNTLSFRLLPSNLNQLSQKKISQLNGAPLNLGNYSAKNQTVSQSAKEDSNSPKHAAPLLTFEAANAYLQQAEDYCEQKKWNESIAACEKALQIVPKMAEAYKIWGNVLQKMGNYTEAIGYYAKAIEIQPDLPEVYANLGTLYAGKQQWQKAVSYYQKAIDLKDDFAGAYRNLAKVWTKLGERDKALECQFQALNLEPQKSTAIEHYEIGNQFGRQGQVEKAIACYRNAILLNPQFIKAYLNLAEALEQRGEWQEAGAYYRQVLHLTNAAETAHHTDSAERVNTPQLEGSKPIENILAGDRERKQLMPAETGAIVPHIQKVTVNSQSSQSTLDRAIQESALLAGLQPESAEIQADLGSLYAKKQDWPKAIACYQKAIVLNPNFAGAYRNLAKVFSKTGEREKAADAWYRALTLEPDRSPAKQHLQLGKTLLEQGKTEQAVNCYRQAIRLKPELSEAYHCLGDILTQQGKEREAIALYQQSIERNPQDAESYYRLGQICAKQEKWDEAIADLELALKLKPNFPQVRHELNSIIERRAKSGPKNLKENDKKVAKREPDKSIVGYEKASVRNLIKENLNHQKLETGETDRAIAWLQERKLIKLNDTRACLTIVSKNYLPQARVLCETFLEYHPGVAFFVLLVDRVEGYFDPAREKFYLLTLDDIELPSSDIFPYYYTILELNTAVKPFALKYLFKNYDIEQLLYIDPDIQIFRPLSEVWNAFETHSVVLTPHMRQPFRDRHSPSEVGILQSGTYNLGFIGLKRNTSSFELLDWWMEKLYLDCVVDIPNGLFVDQKWMDLIPGYFPDTYMLHDPSYNIAYWNLHERKLEKNKEGVFIVENRPLAFFHFSGYSPKNKNSLSKHQTRHQLADLPVLKELCDGYANQLLNCGYAKAISWPFAYAKLANGIKVNKLINWIMRECLKKNIPFPNPVENADNFCKFLMTPSQILTGKNTPPIITAILHYRRDVAAYYPNVTHNFKDEGFLSWLKNSGAVEEEIEDLYQNFAHHWHDTNIVEDVKLILQRRKDVIEAFPNCTINSQSYAKLIEWLKSSGVREENLDPLKIEQFKKARGGYYKILNLYFLRPDLQKAFCNLHIPKIREQFVGWLKSSLSSLPNINIDEIVWFDLVCELEPYHILLVNLLYNSWVRKLTGSEVNLFEIEKFFKVLELEDNRHQYIKQKIIEFLAFCKNLSPLVQLNAYYCSQGLLNHLFPDAFKSKKVLGELYDYIMEHKNFHNLALHSKVLRNWLDELEAAIQNYNPDSLIVNVAGYFDACTGMGQSGRSMLLKLEAIEVNYSAITLPNVYVDPDTFFSKENKLALMGWPLPGKGVNITIGNADSVKDNREILPSSYWQGRKNVGYWVWETEDLPLSQAKSAISFDEIWTPSEYSARSIRKYVNKPVRVVPHVIDLDEINSVRADRDEFALPKDKLLFGFFFDRKSYLERKNPLATIRAFRKAFGNSPNACLVLKVDSSAPGNYDYEMLKLEGRDQNIIWIEETFDRPKTLRLMNCLDVYISLHRSEGFGLTLAEAMAMGKPVIATKYSGNLEFMNSTNSLLVDAEIVETDRSYGAYPRGTRWADPNIDMAANFMKLLGDLEVRQKYGIAAKKSIQEKLSPIVVGGIVKTLLKKLSVDRLK